MVIWLDKDLEKILGTYSLEEIFEINDLTEVDVLLFLLEAKRVDIPEPKPVDVS